MNRISVTLFGLLLLAWPSTGVREAQSRPQLQAPATTHLASSSPTCCRSHRRHSRIHRSAAEKHLFWRLTGHPHGWPGHVVDHILPLACGGTDSPDNMQWQTIADAKTKDRWERKGCEQRSLAP